MDGLIGFLFGMFFGSTFGFFCFALAASAGREDHMTECMDWRGMDEANDKVGND